MAYIPAKMIESILRKEGIDVNGYNVIDCINSDSMKESDRLGMQDGITEEFDFISEYQLEKVTLTFNVCIVEDYYEFYQEQEIQYYYPYLEWCKIEECGKKEKFINMDVYWDKK